MNVTMSSLQSSIRRSLIGLVVLAALVAGSVAAFWAIKAPHSAGPIITSTNPTDTGSATVETQLVPGGGYETASGCFIPVGAAGILDC